MRLTGFLALLALTGVGGCSGLGASIRDRVFRSAHMSNSRMFENIRSHPLFNTCVGMSMRTDTGTKPIIRSMS
jgi:hypothetical protein